MRSPIARILDAAAHPFYSALRLAGRAYPELFHARHARLARRAGLMPARFLLSFDCDTEKDIDVVSDVHGRLRARGVRPVYAVPGKLLEKGADVYGRIACDGAEFLNHGYFAHTYYRPDGPRYVSSFFYDWLPDETIEQDVRLGHASVERVTGKSPTGFRVPHFGTFQSKVRLQRLYRLLETMNYQYSSSTVPWQTFSRGPVHRVRPTIWEVPVMGGYNQPLDVFDTYNFRFSPHRTHGPDDYVRQFQQLVEYFCFGGRGGLVNIYADPSQVYDWPQFFDCLELAAPHSVSSFQEIVNLAGT